MQPATTPQFPAQWTLLKWTRCREGFPSRVSSLQRELSDPATRPVPLPAQAFLLYIIGATPIACADAMESQQRLAALFTYIGPYIT